jgi:hypothetical protein
MLKLLGFFPSELFDFHFEGNIKKEEKSTINMLGRFLLIGNEIN